MGKAQSSSAASRAPEEKGKARPHVPVTSPAEEKQLRAGNKPAETHRQPLPAKDGQMMLAEESDTIRDMVERGVLRECRAAHLHMNDLPWRRLKQRAEQEVQDTYEDNRRDSMREGGASEIRIKSLMVLLPEIQKLDEARESQRGSAPPGSQRPATPPQDRLRPISPSDQGREQTEPNQEQKLTLRLSNVLKKMTVLERRMEDRLHIASDNNEGWTAQVKYMRDHIKNGKSELLAASRNEHDKEQSLIFYEKETAAITKQLDQLMEIEHEADCEAMAMEEHTEKSTSPPGPKKRPEDGNSQGQQGKRAGDQGQQVLRTSTAGNTTVRNMERQALQNIPELRHSATAGENLDYVLAALRVKNQFGAFKGDENFLTVLKQVLLLRIAPTSRLRNKLAASASIDTMELLSMVIQDFSKGEYDRDLRQTETATRAKFAKAENIPTAEAELEALKLLSRQALASAVNLTSFQDPASVDDDGKEVGEMMLRLLPGDAWQQQEAARHDGSVPDLMVKLKGLERFRHQQTRGAEGEMPANNGRQSYGPGGGGTGNTSPFSLNSMDPTSQTPNGDGPRQVGPQTNPDLVKCWIMAMQALKDQEQSKRDEDRKPTRPKVNNACRMQACEASPEHEYGDCREYRWRRNQNGKGSKGEKGGNQWNRDGYAGARPIWTDRSNQRNKDGDGRTRSDWAGQSQNQWNRGGGSGPRQKWNEPTTPGKRPREAAQDGAKERPAPPPRAQWMELMDKLSEADKEAIMKGCAPKGNQ